MKNYRQWGLLTSRVMTRPTQLTKDEAMDYRITGRQGDSPLRTLVSGIESAERAYSLLANHGGQWQLRGWGSVQLEEQGDTGDWSPFFYIPFMSIVYLYGLH